MRKSIREIEASVPHCRYSVNIGILRVPNMIEDYNIDMDPEYQRDYVWTNKQKSQFVGALIESCNQMPPIIINNTGKNKLETTEILDGKQRISAILDWIDGKIDAECPCGEIVSHDSLTVEERRGMMTTTIKMNAVDLDQKEAMRYYLRLNAGGTIHTEEELNNVKKLLKE